MVNLDFSLWVELEEKNVSFTYHIIREVRTLDKLNSNILFLKVD